MRLAMTSMKMLARLTEMLLIGLLLIGMGIAVASQANAAEGLQPILLTTSQVCGCSPASANHMSSNGWTYVGAPLPAESSEIPTVSPVITLQPQSTGQNLAQNIALKPITIIAPAPSGVVVPGYQGYQTVRVLRPVLPGPTPPIGYRLGKGLIGQPKLYVPGQPIRNFVRYLSP